MARIVLTCWGSHGDIDPFLGLGGGLRARGHSVALATIEYYRPLVTSSGLDFHPLRPAVDPTETHIVERIMDRRRGTEFILKRLLIPSLEAMFDDVRAAAKGADLLVSHPITFATPIVAEHQRLPWASVVLAPMSFFSAHDMPVIPPAPWVKSLERLGQWPGRFIVSLSKRVTAQWEKPIHAFRQRLGLPPGRQPVFDGQHSPRLVLAMFSKVLGAPQPDWPAHVVVTGHPFHDAPHGTSLAPELEAFLASGAAPVVFTLGSSVVLIANDFWRQSVEAAGSLGLRAVLLAGPDGSVRLRAELASRGQADILAVERAPHSLLFPRAAAVVQQCGIGTLAQSLRSGRPFLAVPHAHDQPDNAFRAARLGVARILYPQRYAAARVAKELKALLEEPAYASASERVADVVRTEQGIDTACDAIERTFALG
jgi:rhamnosyltransferase subunit B